MYLHILDCSQYIYAGYNGNKSGKWITRGVRETNGEYESRTANVNGVMHLLNEINRFNKELNVVIPVFDRPASIKREMYKDTFGYDGYKANRGEPNWDIIRQRRFAEEILRKCGFPVQAVEGYEADDVIHTLVQIYKNDYEKIFIHNRDSDLFYLVDDNVEIAKIGKLGKSITLENYYYTVLNDYNCFYNTIHLYKTYYGDSSDCIPGIGKEWAARIDEFIGPNDFRKLGDLELCRNFIRQAIKKYFNCPNSQLVLPTFNIVTPLDVPYDELDDSEYDVNWEMFSKYYLNNFDASADKWDCESSLDDYIESCYD